MRTRACIIALLTVAMAGCGGDGGGGQKRVTVRVDALPHAEILSGHALTLRGTLDGDDGRHRVRVEADPYPFDSFRDLKQTTAERGDFTAEVKPVVDTRYRVSVADGKVKGTSRPLKVTAFLRTTVKGAVRGGKLKIVAFVRLPAGAKVRPGPVYFYARPNGAKRFELLGSSGRYAASGHRIAAVLTAPAPSRAGKADVCVKNGWAVGAGPQAPTARGCGQRFLR